MDDWDMLPDDRDYRLMAEEFAKLKVRRDVVETGVGLPDYSKEYAESCYYTQCAIDSLIRYYFERSGERGAPVALYYHIQTLYPDLSCLKFFLHFPTVFR